MQKLKIIIYLFIYAWIHNLKQPSAFLTTKRTISSGNKESKYFFNDLRQSVQPS